ncbi:hypothetical protein ACS0TY_018530 [Phlomoides rotata]
MESPTSVSPYFTRSAKKRVFPGASSSAGFKEVEVLEMSPPPVNPTSKSNSFKQKEVIRHEIIDVDLEEDHHHEIIDVDLEEDDGATVYVNGNMGKSGTGKISENGTVDDSVSNLFHGEDDWINSYYDDITFDYHADFQPNFDHMDIPPGVEAPFPWLPSCPQFNTEVKKTSTSTSSSSQHELNSASISHEKPIQIRHLKTSVSSKVGHLIAGLNLKRKQACKWLEYGRGEKKPTTSEPSGSPMPHNPGNKPLPHSVTRRSFRLLSSSLLSNVNIPSSYTTLSTPKTASGEGSYMPVGSSLMNGSASAPGLDDSTYIQNGTTPARVEEKNVDVILQNFDLFKIFDTVEDYSDHYYSKSGSSAKQPPKNWAKRIQEEWKILEKDLPDSIFVRVYESRMDLLRAVIVGAEGTPYHDGLFFFDVHFPSSYPNVPPKVHYHSGGLRINPNLYNCGKVCLSLLNTWSGGHEEKWIPGVSTMLQVLVSIQGLILNVKPYFNEPGYARSNGSKSGEEKSLKYNESTFMLSLQTMVYNMRRPPKCFEEFVVGYFRKHAQEILVSCKAYLDGAQVGCLVKGGVQDVDEGDTSCSQGFRKNLARFITTLVNTFSQIGAKDCEHFLSLSQKATNADSRSVERRSKC